MPDREDAENDNPNNDSDGDGTSNIDEVANGTDPLIPHSKMILALNQTTTGFEPWTTNGYAHGTHIIKDINTRTGSSIPHSMKEIGGITYFGVSSLNASEDSLDKLGLWRTDGTESGTVLIKEFGSGDFIRNLMDVEGAVYFLRGNRIIDMWRSDGTTGGTVKVELGESVGLDENKSVISMAHVGTDLFFSTREYLADWGNSAYELWKFNLSTGEVERVKDFGIYESTSLRVEALTEMNGVLYFAAKSTEGRTAAIWRSDGTEVGTKIVKDDIRARSFTKFKNKLFFSVRRPRSAELWFTNGTEDGTDKLGDFSDDISNMRVSDNMLYFTDDDDYDGAKRIWKTNGTEDGTEVIYRTDDRWNYIKDIALIDNTLYFRLKIIGNPWTDAPDTAELWKVSAAGGDAEKVQDLGGDSDFGFGMTAIDDRLYFDDYDALHGFELWSSDGSEGGATMLKDITTDTLSSSSHHYRTPHGNRRLVPSEVFALGAYSYFMADDGNGSKLWKSNGTNAGTEMVTTAENPDGFAPYGLIKVGATLYFVTLDAEKNALWKTDGSSILKLKNIASSTEGSGRLIRSERSGGSVVTKIRELTDVNGTLYFVYKQELWSSTGTVVGTSMVKDFAEEEPLGGYLSTLTAVDNTLYFTYQKIDTGWGDLDPSYSAVWSSTGETTQNLKSFSGSRISSIAGLGEHIYFSENEDNGNMSRLWKMSPTGTSAEITKELSKNADADESASVRMHDLLAVGDKLYFAFERHDGGGYATEELWVSDGTGAETKLLNNSYIAYSDNWELHLQNINDTLYYVAPYGEDWFNWQLWTSDATAEGTIVLKEATIDSEYRRSGKPYIHGVLDGKVIYSAGKGLWKTDGTPDGTTEIVDGMIGGIYD